jgi:hypothetical protein
VAPEEAALTPEILDKVMTELVIVSRSAMSKREEAANLARIWGGVEDGRERAWVWFAAEAGAAVTPKPPARRRARWRRVA